MSRDRFLRKGDARGRSSSFYFMWI